MVNNSTNINKTKESLNSDGQQFHQYQQNKRKFKQWWSTILPISTKLKKCETVMVNNSTNINKTKQSLNSDSQQFTNINKTKESLNSDGQQFYQYQQNKRKFKQWWSTILLISTKWIITSDWTRKKDHNIWRKSSSWIVTGTNMWEG